MIPSIGRCTALLLAASLFIIFGMVNSTLVKSPHQAEPAELTISLPLPVQVMSAAGDRYLAAVIGGIRALVTDTQRMSPVEYALLARIQSDVAWLNPAHEDNYYMAAAILPWNGQLQASQYILSRAADARPFDWQPPFYTAFNHYYFLKDPISGAQWLRRASLHTDSEQHKLAFQQISALWAAKSPDKQMAIRMHRELIQATKHREFAAFLEKRIIRLENLLAIEQASLVYSDKFGEKPQSMAQLVTAGVLDIVPVDPFGLQYGFAADGSPTAVIENVSSRKSGKP